MNAGSDRTRFRLYVAAAAAALLVVIGAGVWIKTRNDSWAAGRTQSYRAALSSYEHGKFDASIKKLASLQ